MRLTLYYVQTFHYFIYFHKSLPPAKQKALRSRAQYKFTFCLASQRGSPRTPPGGIPPRLGTLLLLLPVFPQLVSLVTRADVGPGL